MPKTPKTIPRPSETKDSRTKLNALARNVRALRIEKGFTQASLAKAAGCSMIVIHHTEKANNFPSLPVYWAICDALGQAKGPLLS